MAMTIFSPLPRKHYEPPRLVVRTVGDRQYYWNWTQQRWVRYTRRCPYL
jgi:hypothetical protein